MTDRLPLPVRRVGVYARITMAGTVDSQPDSAEIRRANSNELSGEPLHHGVS